MNIEWLWTTTVGRVVAGSLVVLIWLLIVQTVLQIKSMIHNGRT